MNPKLQRGMINFEKLVKEPLLHFLVAGAIVFGAYGVFSEKNSATDGDITVTKQSLLMFIQYRTKAFKADDAEARLAAMSAAAVDRLVDEYVREEALFREAVALGLDANDDVIRQRMIEKMEYLAEGLADADTKAGAQVKQRAGVSPEFMRREAAIKNIVAGYTVSRSYNHSASEIKQDNEK